MLTFKQFKDIEIIIDEDVPYEFGLPILSEEIHHIIKDILDSSATPVDGKLSMITREARKLIANGQSTGFENDKPLKGSSRAVFFPTDHKPIELDGQRIHVPTAVKIAFPGQLDKYTGHHQLLGEMQNYNESTTDYAVIRPIHGHTNIHVPGNHPKFETNPDGVTAPILSTHPDHHYLEMGRADKFNAKDLREYTKHPDFKKGLSHQEIKKAMEYHHDMANGQQMSYYQDRDSELHEHISDHPHTTNMLNAMHDMGMHPADLTPRNMGIWTHPLTGVRHPVMIDYGFSTEIGKLYHKARMAIPRKTYY